MTMARLSVFSACIILFMSSCQKQDMTDMKLSQSLTGLISEPELEEATHTSAILAVSFPDLYYLDILEKGILIHKSAQPLSAGVKIPADNGNFWQISRVDHLDKEVEYKARAYIVTSAGSYYGQELSFITRPTKTKVRTARATSITGTSAITGGNIINFGPELILSRGVCYGTRPSPTTLNNMVTAGSGTGVFSAAITGLSPGNSYFVRAFAQTPSGTVYGNQDRFITESNADTVYRLVYVSGDNQTYPGGGMPQPMVFRVLNTATSNYLTELESANLAIVATAIIGYQDASFNNFNDYCNDNSLECFGGYYYIPIHTSGSPFTLEIRVSLSENGTEVDHRIISQNIIVYM